MIIRRGKVSISLYIFFKRKLNPTRGLWSLEAPLELQSGNPPPPLQALAQIRTGISSQIAPLTCRPQLCNFLCFLWLLINLCGKEGCSLPATFVLLLRKLLVSHKIRPPKKHSSLPPSLQRLQTRPESSLGSGGYIPTGPYFFRAAVSFSRITYYSRVNILNRKHRLTISMVEKAILLTSFLN